MTINMEKPYVVGMDIGGGKYSFGIVDSRGNVLVSDSVKTQQYDKIDEYVDAVSAKTSSADCSRLGCREN